MRANYVSRDKKKGRWFTTVWCVWDAKPGLDEEGQFDILSNESGDYTSITKAEAVNIVGSVLRPGQVWDRRRGTIR